MVPAAAPGQIQVLRPHSPSWKIIACSTTASSPWTLPGQWYAARTLIPSLLTPTTPRL